MAEDLLVVKDLCKSFGAVQATDSLSFSVARNEIHALIGPNGAGKTTLVNLLGGELRPDSGSIIFNGEEISRNKPYTRAQKGLGRSFQISSVFENLTVAENFALAILAQCGGNIRFWQKALSHLQVRKKLPKAMARVDLLQQQETLARDLSHGEKRQLEVGMALTGKPQLLLLDEPMAGQGAGGTLALSEIIGAFKGKLAVLLVEHDMDVVFALADRITVLVYGSCIASGTPEEIRCNRLVQEAYLGDSKDA